MDRSVKKRRKYTLTNNVMDSTSAKPLYQIEACIDIPVHGVKKGDLGGWVESEDNLSHMENCWIDSNSYVFDGGCVEGNAFLFSSQVYSDSKVSGNSRVAYSNIANRSAIKDNAMVDHSLVSRSIIEKNTVIYKSQVNNVRSLHPDIIIESSEIRWDKQVKRGGCSPLFILSRCIIDRCDIQINGSEKPNFSIHQTATFENVTAIGLNMLFVKAPTRLVNVYMEEVEFLVPDSDKAVYVKGDAGKVQFFSGIKQLTDSTIIGNVCLEGHIWLNSSLLEEYTSIKAKGEWVTALTDCTLKDCARIESDARKDKRFLSKIEMDGDDVYKTND